MTHTELLFGRICDTEDEFDDVDIAELTTPDRIIIRLFGETSEVEAVSNYSFFNFPASQFVTSYYSTQLLSHSQSLA